TKATTAQIALLAILAFSSQSREKEGQNFLTRLIRGARVLNKNCPKKAAALALRLRSQSDIYILGRGLNFPIAREAGIKIAEVSYIHAEGLAAGELKHYSLALIRKGVPVFFLMDAENRAAILNNAEEVASRGGLVIGVGPKREKVFDAYLPVEKAGYLQPILNLIAMQHFSYALAISRGCDPDRPRNLAKSVTVK
ncbi:MAG: SIS domain-containing protein, partial [bacterium]|nr:SIS domain-containing protein [bacterium]